jgi:hypothetical protein
MSETYIPAPPPDFATWMYAQDASGNRLPVHIMGDQAGNAPHVYVFPDNNGYILQAAQKGTPHMPISANYTTVPADSGKTIHHAPATTGVDVFVTGNNLLPGHELSVVHANPAAIPIGIVFSPTDVIHDGDASAVYNPSGTGPAKSYVAPATAHGSRIEFKLHDQSGGLSHWHVTSKVKGPNGGFA